MENNFIKITSKLKLLKLFTEDNINKIYYYRDNLLINSIKNNSIICIDYLIKNGININIPLKSGQMPLHYCALFNSYKCIDIFIKNGANVNERSIRDGYTPLHFAVFNDYDKFIKILIKYGANINIVDHYGHSALLIAIENDHIKSIHALKNNKKSIFSYFFI